MTSVPEMVDIVPGQSIGSIRVGISRNDLPRQAIVQGPGGVVDGLHFLLSEEDLVEDIWIEDIRTFPGELRLLGKTIPRNASVEEVEAAFGKCTRVPGIKGGIFFNCAAGVALGQDFSGKTLQVRVKPIGEHR